MDGPFIISVIDSLKPQGLNRLSANIGLSSKKIKIRINSIYQMSTIETLRKPKILGMSIFDWVASLTGAVLIGIFLQ